MSSPACVRRVEVGAYVLGALDPAERSALEQHLPTCPTCTAELSDLAGLPGLLSRLSPAEAEHAAAPPPAQLLEVMLGRARRRRHRLRLLASAAAAVAVIGLGTGLGLAATHGSSQQAVLAATAGPVDAHATLRAGPAGTAIDLHLSGVPASTRCRLIVTATDGSSIDAGTWYANYDGQAGVHETAALNRTDVSSLRIETLTGHPLITIPVAGA